MLWRNAVTRCKKYCIENVTVVKVCKYNQKNVLKVFIVKVLNPVILLCLISLDYSYSCSILLFITVIIFLMNQSPDYFLQ